MKNRNGFTIFRLLFAVAIAAILAAAIMIPSRSERHGKQQVSEE